MSSELPTLEQQLSPLFERVVSILEQARSNVVRSVNHNTVLANWLIGREIVLQLQQGQQRAEYGKQVIEALSARLNRNYGKGFSATNLWYFRQFYLTYPDRIPIPHPTGGESTQIMQIAHPTGGKNACSPRYNCNRKFNASSSLLKTYKESRMKANKRSLGFELVKAVENNLVGIGYEL